MKPNFRKIDIENWERKAQFDFFKDFDQPFFNVTANVDISAVLSFSKAKNLPFFYCSLHAILKAINQIPAFKLRFEGDDLVAYERIHGGVTILTEQKTFLYCTILYYEDINTFVKEAQAAVEDLKKRNDFLPHGRKDVVYVSVLPWISFTGFQHARTKIEGDSIPRVVIGKYFEEQGAFKLPISVEVNHALADGYHVGLFFDSF